MYNNLSALTREYNELRQKRADLHYTGRADLDCMNRMSSIRHNVTAELNEVRAKISVCPLGMLSELRHRENELLEWKRKYS